MTTGARAERDALYGIPFPPPPRSWPDLMDRVLTLLDASGRIDWHPVHLPGLPRPWIGIKAKGVTTARPWEWDVVTPDDADRAPGLTGDPLVVALEQDVVVVDLTCADRPGLNLRLQVPVTRTPDRIDFPAAALPPRPWQLCLCTGWSAGSIADGLRSWSARYYGRSLTVDPGSEAAPDDSEDTDRYSLDEGLWISGEAFDRLLELDPAAAAMATTALRAANDALLPFR